MCGIIGYTGFREVEPILLTGLRRLEYRGYDSAGIATSTGSTLHLRKCIGRISNLTDRLARHPAPGCLGIGHTRWATHGGATEANAHPHLGGTGEVAVVHNGVIENYLELKRELQAQGFAFQSETDTEVIAHLIAHYLQDDLAAAVRQALGRLQGTYALGIISPRFPGLLVGACSGSPLVLGTGEGENFLASDPSALAGYTKQVVYLQDGQICVLTPDGWEIHEENAVAFNAPVCLIDWQPGDTEKGDFEHFMLKEIYEQPKVLALALDAHLGELNGTPELVGLHQLQKPLQECERILMTGCGTSYHAALVGKYLLEEIAHVPVEVEYASELRYRHRPSDHKTVLLALTQSGETADTLAALRTSKRRHLPTIALCNVVGSTITREADHVVYLHAGPEICVASTKAFTAQVAVLAMLAFQLGRWRYNTPFSGRMLEELHTLPDAVRRSLACEADVQRIAQEYYQVSNLLCLGRQYLYPVALEGALKIKEVSYIHAEGYPAAEMKHGPIALVDEKTPSIVLAPRDALYEKVMINLEEIKARGGPVIAVATEGDEEIVARADDVVFVPKVPDYLQPLVAVVPLQLLAYHLALLRGCDVDKPRNLAKSVTVE